MCACSTHTNIMPHTHNPPIYMQIAYIHSTRTYNCACKYIYKLPCCHTHHTPNSIMCCSVLQCAAVCSNVLQCAAVCCSTHTNNVAVHIQTTAVCCSTHTNNVAVHIQTTLQYTYKQLCYRTPTTHQILECVTVYCRMSCWACRRIHCTHTTHQMLQRVAVYCSVLQECRVERATLYIAHTQPT